VDVWVNFQNGERVEQLEDQSFSGKVSARYRFKDGQIVDQEQLKNAEPPRLSPAFVVVEEILRTIDPASTSAAAGTPPAASLSGLESGAE
jgi:hypothetical protein